MSMTAAVTVDLLVTVIMTPAVIVLKISMRPRLRVVPEACVCWFVVIASTETVCSGGPNAAAAVRCAKGGYTRSRERDGIKKLEKKREGGEWNVWKFSMNHSAIFLYVSAEQRKQKERTRWNHSN